MDFYGLLLRPLLFRLPAENAQKLAEFALKRRLLWRLLNPLFSTEDPRLRTTLAGIPLTNPVGLAAGYDKDCAFLPSMLNLGFGYVVGGTVTLSPRPGNPKPRIARHPKAQALVNSLGFPGTGVEAVSRHLERYQHRRKPILISISGLAIEEFLECHRRLEPLADAVEINISSPNTAGVQQFQEPSLYSQLLARLNRHRKKPLFLKLPPYFDDRDRQRVMTLVRLSVQNGIEGVTAVNTKPVPEPLVKMGRGGLSGRPLLEDMLRIVEDIHREAGGKLAINACGGIFTAEDTWRALQAGATTVQLLTGLIYRGPATAKVINRGLLRIMDARKVESLEQLRRV